MTHLNTIIACIVISLPSSVFAQFSGELKKMINDSDPEYSEYEQLIYDASKYVFDNSFDVDSKEWISATKVVEFWMNKDTELVYIPTFGNFYEAITNNKQQFLYVIAMINYRLDQKLNHNRLVPFVPIEGQKYSDQEDVREVQIEGAKIILQYSGDKNNNFTLPSQSKKYSKAWKKKELEKVFFK
ncbi:MAG: hypothetical protein AAF901_08920 [Bacteroidota bacterium]